MTDARRRFPAGGSDWGQSHLSLDAIVAFVDDELTATAHARAAAHLRVCTDCAAEVVSQGQARAELRAAGGPRLPSSLLSSLRSIPLDTELPPPPPGLAMTADGGLVAGLVAPGPDDADRRARGRRARSGRRARFGAGAAVSGIALGALAFAAPALPAPQPDAPVEPARGSFGGTPFAPASAVLGVRPAVPAAEATPSPSPTSPTPPSSQPAPPEGSGPR